MSEIQVELAPDKAGKFERNDDHRLANKPTGHDRPMVPIRVSNGGTVLPAIVFVPSNCPNVSVHVATNQVAVPTLFGVYRGSDEIP